MQNKFGKLIDKVPVQARKITPKAVQSSKNFAVFHF